MSYCQKISILEKTTQMFVCSICCDFKSGITGKPFATSNPSLFLEHQRCVHPSINEFECLYCCCHLQTVNLMQHIQNHFSDLPNNRFSCPHCADRVKVNTFSCLEHLELEHPKLPPECPHCRTQFSDRGDLLSHLKKNLLYIFHCSFADCFVKSHSMPGVLSHLRRAHNGSRCLKVECLFTCAERISSRGQCTCLLGNQQQSPQSPLKTTSQSGEDSQLIALPYSVRVLSKLSSGFDERLRDDLTTKMAQYSKFKVRLELVDGQKQFICSTCQYRSVHSLADVRKHILGCHCSVSTSYTRLCLRASRLDTNSFSLFSDRKLISFANEKLKRAESGTGGWDASGDNVAMHLLDDSEPEQDSNIDSVSRPVKRPALSGGTIGSIKRARLTQRQCTTKLMRPDSPVPEVGQPLERHEKIDRVIHLNYSWMVLSRLIAGQCPDRYLPILRQKMDVYAMHSILLTRRNGKRYFLCSHCPNCSPHGMNDIRKHILGVHARLPERFKAAAMYCSRMNRDNYGLLSDDELLKKNQDMVRWRTVPPGGGPGSVASGLPGDELGGLMDPLGPLLLGGAPGPGGAATVAASSDCYDDNSSPGSTSLHNYSNQQHHHHNNHHGDPLGVQDQQHHHHGAEEQTHIKHQPSQHQHNIFLSGGDGTSPFSFPLIIDAPPLVGLPTPMQFSSFFIDAVSNGNGNNQSIFPGVNITNGNGNSASTLFSNGSSPLIDDNNNNTAAGSSFRPISLSVPHNNGTDNATNHNTSLRGNGRSRRSIALKSKASASQSSHSRHNHTGNGNYSSSSTAI